MNELFVCLVARNRLAARCAKKVNWQFDAIKKKEKTSVLTFIIRADAQIEFAKLLELYHLPLWMYGNSEVIWKIEFHSKRLFYNPNCFLFGGISGKWFIKDFINDGVLLLPRFVIVGAEWLSALTILLALEYLTNFVMTLSHFHFLFIM